MARSPRSTPSATDLAGRSFATLALACAVGCAPGAPADPIPERPRAVVVVLVDGLRPDHLGVYGAERDTSPHLDAWSEVATRFAVARTASPAAVPAFGALLAAGDPWAFDPADHLAHRLGAAGWETQLLAGSLFLTDAFGFGEGWTVAEHRELVPAAEQVARAVELLQARQAPTFQLVEMTDLLLPYPGDEAFHGLFAGEPPTDRVHALAPELGQRQQLATAPLTEPEREWLTGRYDQSIRAVDAALEPLLAALGPHDTLVLTAPHGEALGEGGRVGHGWGLGEEQVRVPLVIRGPGFVGRAVDTSVMLADLGATALVVAGAELPTGATGQDLRLAGSEGWRERRQRLGPTVYGPARVGVVDGAARWVMGGGETLTWSASPGDGAPPARTADWSGAARTAWKEVTGQDTRRVWHLQLQPWDASLEPLTWRGATEVVVRHPQGFVALWAPPMPIHAAPWRYELSATEVRISSANGRLPRELLLQPASPADLRGLELSVVVDGARHDAAWVPSPDGGRVPSVEPVLRAGPQDRAVSLSVRWAPPPDHAPGATP